MFILFLKFYELQLLESVGFIIIIFIEKIMLVYLVGIISQDLKVYQ